MNLKTQLLNKIRLVGKYSPIESALANLSRRKIGGSIFGRIAPNNYQYQKNSVRRFEADCIQYELDISDYMQYCIYFGIEIEPRQALYNLVQNGTTVVDVGTNIGETLLNFARINRNGLNVGFEPVPQLFEKAKANIELNEFKNIVLENAGLSNAAERLIFNEVSKYNSGGTYLSRDPNPTAGRSVSAYPLDQYVSEMGLQDISLIKIDVEGFELNVLEGAAETISRFNPLLFIEVNDAFLKRQGRNAILLFDFLTAQNYRIAYAENGKEVDLTSDMSERHFDIIARRSDVR